MSFFENGILVEKQKSQKISNSQLLQSLTPVMQLALPVLTSHYTLPMPYFICSFHPERSGGAGAFIFLTGLS